jgi:hypothetical protein
MFSALFGLKCPECGRRTRNAIPYRARMVCEACSTRLTETDATTERLRAEQATESARPLPNTQNR